MKTFLQFVCFPYASRMFPVAEPYVSLSGNVRFGKEDLENAVKKEKMCGRVPENSCIFAAIESCINV